METEIRIAVVSNILFEPYFATAAKQFFGENTVVSSIPFGEHTDSECKKQLANAELIIVWLSAENFLSGLHFSKLQQDLNETVALCKKLYADLSRISYAKILWFLFDDYDFPFSAATGYVYCNSVDRVNLNLKDALSEVLFVDLKSLVAHVGVSNAYTQKGKYRWNAPYSKELIEAAVKEIYKQYLIEKGVTKKCLVLDCDNVLWGGILSEEGVENIRLSSTGLGRVYYDFQRFVLSLYNHGVILAICSKNDISDVLTVFREHSEMILREEHISCFQVNWDDKPNNIQKIAKRLNIGLDSIVFVDDSVIEVQAVKMMLPEVFPILYQRYMDYEQFSCFNLKSVINREDNIKRNKTYKTDVLREELREKYIDYSEYVKALEIKLDIHKATPIEYNRLSELTQRTNKCTNGRRYTVSEIQERQICDMVHLYSVSVSDRFSDLGIVGGLEIDNDTLTLFSLSCRALGREVEKKMMEFIVDRFSINRIEFKSTGKNADTRILLSETFPDAVLSYL